MPPQYPGNTYLSFVKLIELEQIDERTYRSTAPPFSPGGSVGSQRAYGGHVFMQAAWAACHTVPKGFLLHVSDFHLYLITNRLPLSHRTHPSPLTR